jgi:acyl-CoA reductase-like NAD-dependent aldehyde dehydrogenase
LANALAPKTPKLLIGGALVRSESGRTIPVSGVNLPLASRKDLRDAVAAATKAQHVWAATTAYNRGQVLYRLAEMIEESDGPHQANPSANALVEECVHFAGWTDKAPALLSNVNPVAGSFHNFTQVTASGVAGVICPEEPIAALRSILAPIAVGCAVVAVLHPENPVPILALAESICTSDLPAGVVNLLTGNHEELLPHLCAHVGVETIDVSGSADAARWKSECADSVKRTIDSRDRDLDALSHLEAYCESKTVWHPRAW